MPIVVVGKHLATIFLTQFFFEGELPDRNFFTRQAQDLGYDLKPYLAAIDAMPLLRISWRRMQLYCIRFQLPGLSTSKNLNASVL